MEEFEYDGVTYYYDTDNDMICDENHFALDRATSHKAATAYFENHFFALNTPTDYFNLIKKMKCCELFGQALDLALESIKKFPDHKKHIADVMPMITSCYRELNQPLSAIDIYNRYHKTHYGHESSALLTSVAAAYCDINDFLTADRYARRAYAIQGGPVGYKNELSLVFQRIKTHKDINIPPNLPNQIKFKDPNEDKNRIKIDDTIIISIDNKTKQYTIVYDKAYSDYERGIIDINSPLAIALLGKHINDEFQYKNPLGKYKKIIIKSIKRSI